MIERFLVHYKYLFGFAMNLTKNEQVAEDILSIVTVQLLQGKTNEFVTNDKSFFGQYVKNAYLNYKRTNRKYAYQETEVGIDDLFQQDMVDSIAMKQLLEMSKELPKKQREQVEAAFDGDKICDTENIYVTSKTHRRLGMLKLKDMVNS